MSELFSIFLLILVFLGFISSLPYYFIFPVRYFLPPFFSPHPFFCTSLSQFQFPVLFLSSLLFQCAPLPPQFHHHSSFVLCPFRLKSLPSSIFKGSIAVVPIFFNLRSPSFFHLQQKLGCLLIL